MMQIPLAIIPNQTLSFVADSDLWELHIFQAVSLMYMDIKINGNLILSATRCVGGSLLIPYDYMWKPKYGNLVFDATPDWEQFGVTCNLLYLSNSEAKTWEGLTNGG